MFGIHDFLLFLTAGIVLSLSPGQDTFYIVGRSFSQGRLAGMASVLGIACGVFVHILATAIGLSALLAASTSAFIELKLAGAIYLVYLGVRMYTSRLAGASLKHFERSSFLAIFRQGFLTNLMNAKVYIFFLGFLPQFIDIDSPHRILAAMTLGLCYVTEVTIWYVCLAWFAALLGEKLKHKMNVADMMNRVAGVLFIILGIHLALVKP